MYQSTETKNDTVKQLIKQNGGASKLSADKHNEMVSLWATNCCKR